MDVSCVTGEIIKEDGERGIVTNQRAELTAVYVAIQLCSKLSYYKPKEHVIQIYTDSEYSINTFTNYCHTWEDNGWRKADRTQPKNLDIICTIWDLMKQHRVMFFFTKAHTGNKDFKSIGNDTADKLAKKATQIQVNKK